MANDKSVARGAQLGNLPRGFLFDGRDPNENRDGDSGDWLCIQTANITNFQIVAKQ